MLYCLVLRKKLSVLIFAAVFANAQADAISAPPSSPHTHNLTLGSKTRTWMKKLLPLDTRAAIKASVIVALVGGSLLGSLIYFTSDDHISKRLGDKNVRIAQSRHYVGDYIHYLDQEGNARTGEVARTLFDNMDKEVFLLTDGKEVPAEQFMGVDRVYGWGGKTDFDSIVYFSTEHVEALNDEARLFIADGLHSIIEADVQSIFSSGYLEVSHDLDNGDEALFLISRDKIIYHHGD